MEALRQSVMCSVDLTPHPLEYDKYGHVTARSDVFRECAVWDELEAWARPRAVHRERDFVEAWPVL